MRLSDEKVSYYSKTVEVSDSGTVFASIYAHAEDGHNLRRCAFNYWTSGNPFSSLERRCEKAHKWIDSQYKIIRANESQYERLNDA